MDLQDLPVRLQQETIVANNNNNNNDNNKDLFDSSDSSGVESLAVPFWCTFFAVLLGVAVFAKLR